VTSSRALHLLAAAAVVLAGACGGSSSPGAARATSTTVAPAPTITGPQAAPARPTTTDPCAVGAQPPLPGSIPAQVATALAFAPDGRLFFAERSGTVRVVQDGAAREFATVPTTTAEAGGGYSERGLLGLAVSPTFASDRFVYAFYSNTDRSRQDVVRWTDCAGEGRDATVLIRLPAGSDCCHKGGRLAFGPDAKLYVTLGDTHSATTAQDTSDVRGKVLRYNANGTVPADNPFGAGDPVWAFGLRNPFGLAVSAGGQVAVTVNGPTGDAGSPSTGFDTVVAAVGRGAGYQWPRCYGYSHPIRGQSCGDGQREPDWSSEDDTVVPTGAAFVDSAGPGATAGKLVFCTLNAGMQILTPGSPHATVTQGPSGCRLDVKQAPDHSLWFSDTTRISRMG
jgi:glucose/arabinose dehydrogenase